MPIDREKIKRARKLIDDAKGTFRGESDEYKALVDAFNTIENPDRVHIETATLAVKDGTVEIPAHTVAILYVE